MQSTYPTKEDQAVAEKEQTVSMPMRQVNKFQSDFKGKILAFNEVGLSPADIARKVGLSEDEVEKILQEQESSY